MLRGDGLSLIPSNAVGIMATSNQDPLAFLGTDDPGYLYDITEHSNMRIVVSQRAAGPHSRNTYLGAITSPDGSVVYWVNESEPLP